MAKVWWLPLVRRRRRIHINLAETERSTTAACMQSVRLRSLMWLAVHRCRTMLTGLLYSINIIMNRDEEMLFFGLVS